MIDSAFDRLGIAPGFCLEAAQLEQNYLDRSRLVHPDHHDEAGGHSLEETMRLSAALNDAYSTLADPIRRAEHLVALWGGPDASMDKRLPAEFLEKMLEWREEAENPSSRQILASQLEKENGDLLKQLSEAFARADKDATSLAVRMKEIRLLLNQLRSMRGLLREIEESY